MLMQMIPPPSLPSVEGGKRGRGGCDIVIPASASGEKESLVALRSLDLAQTADFPRASLRVISMGNIFSNFYCLPLPSEITSML